MTCYITSSDIPVKKQPGVYRSRMSVYPAATNKIHKHYGDVAEKIVALALPILKQKLDLPPGLKIRLASMKGRWSGRYSAVAKTAVIDYCVSKKTVLEMLCHELVHAEQFHQGRLENRRVAGKWVSYWNGQKVRAAYRERPYEKEAYDRQVLLADMVINTVGLEKWCSI